MRIDEAGFSETEVQYRGCRVEEPREVDGEYASVVCRTGCRTLKLEVAFPEGFDLGQVRASFDVRYNPRLEGSETGLFGSLTVHAEETERRRLGPFWPTTAWPAWMKRLM